MLVSMCLNGGSWNFRAEPEKLLPLWDTVGMEALVLQPIFRSWPPQFKCLLKFGATHVLKFHPLRLYVCNCL
jgi:hypothetical protein